MNTGIMIVDDHPLVREGLITLISNQRDFCLSGEANGIAEARELVRQTQPDVVIVDLTLKDGNGIALIKELKEQHKRIKLLALSMHDETVFAERALRAGASGYVSKHEASRTIIQAIRTVLDDQLYLSERMMNRVLSRAVGSQQRQQQEQPSPIERLSNREIEVFEMIGRGLTSREIAQGLDLSQRTVDTHRENIKEKLELKNAVELTKHAVQWVLENH